MRRETYILAFLLITSGYVPARAQGLIIPSGSYVIQDGGNFIMGHNFTNNGSYTQNAGTLVFSGTTQSLQGSVATSFKNILVSSGSTTTVSTANHTLSEVLKCDGTLNAGGNLTLLSDSTKTALVDGSGTGDILGNLNIQRYLANSYGYKYFSSPFQSATVSEFSDEVDLNASFPPVHRYDETFTSTGWIHYSNPSNVLTPMLGYAVNFGTSSSPVTADMTGVVNNGNLSLTLYNHNYTYTQGFNFVGNPYPSPIDWDAASGWTRTNVDNAVYYFNASNSDQYSGTYSSYINGISSDGISTNIIPAMQGFFIHVSDGSYPVTGTFGMSNDIRINNLAPVFHKMPDPQNPLLRLSAKPGDVAATADLAVIYFDDKATMGFDVTLDAMKMTNTDDRVPNLYILAGGAERLSISAMPAPGDSISQVPLGIDVHKDGMVTLGAENIEKMPYGTSIYLADAMTKGLYDLTAKENYSVQLPAGKYENRFSIIFSRNKVDNNIFLSNNLNAYSADGKLFVYLNLATGDHVELRVINILGQVVLATELNGFGYHEIPASYTSGIYVVSAYGNKEVFSKKLFIGNDR